MKVQIAGQEVDFDGAVNLMNDEIRDKLHDEMAPCGHQEFIDAYCREHAEKFGAEFVVKQFEPHPGRLFGSPEAARRAVEIYPERFPAGYCYVVEPVRMSADRGVSVLVLAAVLAYSKDGDFLGYCPNKAVHD